MVEMVILCDTCLIEKGHGQQMAGPHSMLFHSGASDHGLYAGMNVSSLRQTISPFTQICSSVRRMYWRGVRLARALNGPRAVRLRGSRQTTDRPRQPLVAP